MVQWRRLREALYNPQANPLVFLISTVCLGISVNLISTLLSSLLIHGHKISTILFAIGFGVPSILAIALAAPGVFRMWSGERERFAEVRRARPHKGLIAIASLGGGIDTAKHAIRYHLPTLEKAWLICSTGNGPCSEPLAVALKSDLERTLGLRTDLIELRPLTIDDFEKNPEAVKDAIDKIYETMPEHFSERDIVIDITGGRKLTTAGAFLAGLPKSRHLEVINPKEPVIYPKEPVAPINPLVPDDPMEIDISFDVKKPR